MKFILNILLITIPVMLAVLAFIFSNLKRDKNKSSKKYLTTFIILNFILLLSGIGNVILQERQTSEDAKQIGANWQIGELTPNSEVDPIVRTVMGLN